MSFDLTEKQTHAIIIVVLVVVAIILVVLVVKASKKEKFRYGAGGMGVGMGSARLRNRSVGGQNSLAARLRNRSVGGQNSLAAKKYKEGFEILYSPPSSGTFALDYVPSRIETRERFASGQTGQGVVGLKAEGFAPMIDAASIQSHLRTKQRIIY